MPGNKKVMIIDDEIDLSLLLQDYFLRKHYEVTVSHSLTEGEAILKTSRPDIVFLDNNLPDGTGWNMAPALAEAYPGIYIVLVSAFHPTVPIMPPGANYRVIEKPISLAELNNQFADF